MMRGTKRFAASDSNPIANNSLVESKRMMAGSPFDAQRAEQPEQLPSEVPSLDSHRAESARQHVRALNTQFASWVQTQLQNHPDELWEDGVHDYLNHASNIMEKFSDVVNWLKANAAKVAPSSMLVSQTDQKKNGSESKENQFKLFLEKPLMPVSAPTASFATSSASFGTSSASFGISSPSFGTSSASFGTSWSSGVFFNNKSPFSFGNQISAPSSQISVPASQSSASTNHDAANAADGEDDAQQEQPSSPSVKKTEEKGIIVVHEVKCKLYVKSSDPSDKDAWKDKGMGHLSIKRKEGVDKGTKESKPTIVVRNDVGKVLLNALIYPGIKTNKQKNSIVTIFHTSDGDGDNNVMARTYLIRTKTEEDRDRLASMIGECAPAT